MSHSRCSRALILAMILAWPFADGVVRALQAQVDGAVVLDGSILPGAIGAATVGAAYQALFAMSGALGVVRFSTDSRLPAGVTLSSLSVLSGVPVETGIFPLTIVATDTLSSAAFPAAMRGVPYSPIILGQSGGIGAALFAVVGGSLPPGLVLSTAGEVTGTPMEAGVFTALVRAADTNGCSGQSEYAVTVNAVPAIGTHPVDRVAAAGNPIVFTAAASGHPSPTYRWQVSTTNGATWSDVPWGAPYTGAGTAALSMTARVDNSGHQYRVLAINSVGTAISAAATLTVHTAPAIAAEPTDHIAVAGSIATFAVSATGNPVPSYRWQVSTGSGASWTDLSDGPLHSGTTTGMLIIASVGPALDGSRYRAVAANSVGSTMSRGAALRVYSAPEIVVHPADRTVVAAGATSFVAAAAGSPPPSYRWQMSAPGGASWDDVPAAAPYSGAGSSVLTIANVDESLSGFRYRLTATNNAGAASSTAATLTVHVPPAGGCMGVMDSRTTRSRHLQRLAIRGHCRRGRCLHRRNPGRRAAPPRAPRIPTL